MFSRAKVLFSATFFIKLSIFCDLAISGEDLLSSIFDDAVFLNIQIHACSLNRQVSFSKENKNNEYKHKPADHALLLKVLNDFADILLIFLILNAFKVVVPEREA